jgi:acetyl-CoA C-acetyltransferase
VSLSGATAIAGAFEHPTRWAPDKTSWQIMAESARGALEDCGLGLDDVDGLFSAGIDMGPMGTVMLAEDLNLKTRLYGSTAASSGMAIGTGGQASRDAAASFSSPYGVTTVGSYALVAQRHMQEYGTTSEQLAEIAVTTRRHAALNPLAKMRNPISIEDVLASRMISEPLRLLDCCITSDGGGALVMTSLERARDLKKQPVVVLGASEAVGHQEIGAADLLTIAARQASDQAFRMAGVTRGDIDLCTIYDSFTITVLVTLENLGFCKRGEGGSFVENGRIGLGGELPLNLDGGGLSSNHPGMRGIFLCIEATRQLRGECGPRQVEEARLALVHGTGGMLGTLHSGATLILARA